MTTTAAVIQTVYTGCNKEKVTCLCQKGSAISAHDHFLQHQENVIQQLGQIEHERQTLLNESNEKIYLLLEEIDHWEKESMEKIQQTVKQCKQKVIDYFNGHVLQIEKKFDRLAERIQAMRAESDLNESDCRHLEEISQKLQAELRRSTNLSIKQQSTTYISNIFIRTPSERLWKQSGVTIAGGNGQGDQSNQLSHPYGICIDDRDQTVYIADYGNARIVEWKANASCGRIIAGNNGKGNHINQLNAPTDVIIDRENNSLIIADEGNRRVMRWSRQTNSHGEILISNIDCRGLAMDNDGSLYVSDVQKNEVKRWKKGETDGAIVAGGNGQGCELNQLDHPTFLFVDGDYALYVSDRDNDRVMKWAKDATEGIVVAGGNGEGSGPTQLCFSKGVIIDQFGQCYVADRGNDRVVRWCSGAKEGKVIVGGNGRGDQANQLHWPMGLAFDGEGNLYVVDTRNSRVQKFLVD